MILEYHRPEAIEGALALLSRKFPKTIPLAGGTDLASLQTGRDVAVVDLQNLNLAGIKAGPNQLKIGAATLLQDLVESDQVPEALRKAAVQSVGLNKRNAATIGGTVVACGGRSLLVTILIAIDSQLHWLPEDKEISLGHYLTLRHDWHAGLLMESIHIPPKGKVQYAMISRTPADLPIICAAVCQWPSGRTRVALGGFGKYPILVVDGPEAAGCELAAGMACKSAGDEWASGEYRSEMATRLVTRLVAELRRTR